MPRAGAAFEMQLDHRVRVFVFDLTEEKPRYLLLRHRPRHEWPLGPVIGAVRVHEHMRDAVVRKVMDDTGLREPHHLIDLAEPARDLFGDMGLIEWPFAWQAGLPATPAPEIVPGPKVGEFTWMGFEEAFRALDAKRDREALVRLQLRLAG
ncbi:MAG: NUDIX hydrolase [Planctomycetota bacterium]